MCQFLPCPIMLTSTPTEPIITVMVGRAKSLWVLFLVLTLSGSALALDKESALELVSPDGEVWLREGWRFAGATLRGNSVLYQYEYGSEQTLEVVVQPRDPRGHAFANTAHLTISYSETGPASARVQNADEVFAFMKEFVAVVGARDDGNLFTGEGVGGPEGETPERLLAGSDGEQAEVGDGWVYQSYLQLPTRVTFLFATPGDTSRARVSLSPMGSNEPAYKTTESFRVWYAMDPGYPDSPEARAALERFLDRFVEVVAQNDNGYSPFGAGPAAEGVDDGEQEGGLDSFQALLVNLTFALFALALAGLFWLGRILVYRLRKWPRRELLVLGACVLVGAILRLFVAPHQPVKVGMIYPLIESAVGLDFLPRYGPGGPALYHLLFMVFPAGTATILLFNSVLGAITAGLAAIFGRDYLKLPGAGMFLPLFLCLTPVFIRDSNSESLLVPACFFMFSGLLLVQAYVADPQARRALVGAWLAVPLLAVTMHIRPELMFPVAALTIGLVPSRQGLWKENRFGGPAIALAAMLVLVLFAVVGAAEGEFARGNLSAGRLNPVKLFLNLGWMNLLVRPAEFPTAISILALFGLGVSFFRGDGSWKRVTYLFVVAFLWLVAYYIDINEESLLRLHVPPAMLFSMVAAFGAAALLEMARLPVKRQLVAAGVTVVFLGSASPSVGRVFFKTNYQTEDRTFAAAVAALPDEPVTIFLLTHDDQPEHALSPQSLDAALESRVAFAPVHRNYPLHLVRPPARNDQVRSLSSLVDVRLPDGRNYFYLSTQCYAIKDAGGEDKWGVAPDPYLSIHPACRWIMTRYGVEPVAIERVLNHSEYAAPFQWYPDELEWMTVGLFELGDPIERIQARDTFVNAATWYFDQAQPHIEANELDKAEAILKLGADALADSVTMQRIMASFYFVAGTRKEDPELLEKSVSYWESIAAVDVHFPFLLSKLGAVYSVYARHMTRDEVLAKARARLEADPDSPVGQYLVGVMLFYAHKDYEQSKKYLEKVLETVDDDPRVYIYLALDHFYLGNQPEAERLVAKAIEAGQGKDPDAYYVRSIITRHQDLDRAVADIQRYLDMSTSSDRVKYEKKQQWLRKELENLKAGKPHAWWTTKTPDEPWNRTDGVAP